MSEILNVLFVYVFGMALGALFFGGLWFTVKKAVTSNRPGLWFFISFLSRILIILVGFYSVSQGRWQPLLGCLLGFITARFGIVKATKLYDEKQIKLKKKEAHHES